MSGLSIDKSREVANALWSIDWISETDGFLECPGLARHTKSDARADCRIMLGGGKPPTIHCLHASCAAEIDAANFKLRSELGKAETAERGGSQWAPGASRAAASVPRQQEESPSYDEEKLTRFAGDFVDTVDAAWLADRSVVDPSTCTSADFLAALYHRDRGEKVLVFTNEHSQGEAVWPDAASLPTRGPEGVWFLAQPVHGEYVPNPRSDPPGKPSRRVAECVREWRFLLLESDNAPARLWLAAVVQLPLRIAAIYTSGSRSVHVLVQVDAPVKERWEKEKAELLRGMVTLGACRGSLSGVRLTRLPGCLRFGKSAEVKSEDGMKRKKYVKFPKPGLQKLLYLAPSPSVRSIASIVPRRNVLEEIERSGSELSRQIATSPVETLKSLLARAEHFASCSPWCKTAAAELPEIIAMREVDS